MAGGTVHDLPDATALDVGRSGPGERGAGLDRRREHPGPAGAAPRRPLPGALDDDEVVESAAYLDLGPTPRSTSAARRFVSSAAPELPAEVLEALQLLTSEVVTNAVIHARTPIEVGLLTTPDAVVVAVHDLDLAATSQQPYPAREGGWGLAMVAALSQRWSTARHRVGGKTTWFRLSRTDAGAVAEGDAARPDDGPMPDPTSDTRTP